MKTTSLIALIAFVAVTGIDTGCHPTPIPSAVTWGLVATDWKLVELNGASIGLSRLPTLVLDPKSTHVSGYGGINSFSGNYTLQGTALSFSSLAATRMAGPPADMKIEADYLKTLEKVTSWKVEANRLLLSAGDELVAQFQGMPSNMDSR